MDLRILEIASNTENNKVLNNFTHQSKNKNPICGDEMEISLIVKNDKVIDMGYQCKSCVYCQASVSLLSQKIKNKNLQEIKNFVISCEISLLRSLARTVFTTLKICFVVTLKPWYSSFLIFFFLN